MNTLPKWQIWAGRIMSSIAILILLADSIGKLMRTKANLDGFAASGIDPKYCVSIGVILLVSLIIFVIPRTAFMGALLLTAYLGGATALNYITGGSALLIALPIVVSIFLWSGLYVASSHLRALVFKDIRS